MLTRMKMLRLMAVVLLATLLCTTGCKTSTPKQSTDTLSVDTIAQQPDTLVVDSLGYQKKTVSGLECVIVVDYPRGDDSLALAVKHFIARELAARYIPRERTDEQKYLRSYPVYSGSVADGKTLLDFYGAGTMRYYADYRKEMSEFSEESAEMPLSQHLRIKKSADTPLYVTYSVTEDRYMGGAHGSFTSYSVNISKSTFKPVVNIVDSTRVRALQPLLRKGAMQYLSDCGESSVADSSLNEYLILPENGQVPLPSHTPWLDNDSLNFVYQQYEIAAYAVGLVSFKIAVKDIRPYLTAEAKALLGK